MLHPAVPDSAGMLRTPGGWTRSGIGNHSVMSPLQKDTHADMVRRVENKSRAGVSMRMVPRSPA